MDNGKFTSYNGLGRELLKWAMGKLPHKTMCYLSLKVILQRVERLYLSIMQSEMLDILTLNLQVEILIKSCIRASVIVYHKLYLVETFMNYFKQGLNMHRGIKHVSNQTLIFNQKQISPSDSIRPSHFKKGQW